DPHPRRRRVRLRGERDRERTAAAVRTGPRVRTRPGVVADPRVGHQAPPAYSTASWISPSFWSTTSPAIVASPFASNVTCPRMIRPRRSGAATLTTETPPRPDPTCIDG